MHYAVDLHIHSALSPCSDDDMTPNNIVNMAILKGLDFIAITDHNSAGNLKPVIECAKGTNLVVVPGMEVETAEEVHLICLLPALEAAISLQNIVYDALPDLKNRPDIFGKQLIMDEHDNITMELDRLLITACSLTIEEVFRIVSGLGGVVIPAHVNRDSYSIISVLGLIPGNLGIRYVEILPGSFYEPPYGTKPIISSDAHRLGDILERVSFIELKEKSIQCLLDKLKS